MDSIWTIVQEHRRRLTATGELDAKRREQLQAWFWSMIDDGLKRQFLARDDVKAYWAKQDTETMSMTPAESDAFLRADIEKWTKVVKAANIKLE